MERLAKRRVLVDPERVRMPGVPPPGRLSSPVSARAGACEEGPARVRLPAVRRARESPRPGDLPRSRDGEDALPGVRGAQAWRALLPVEHVAPDARHALPF